jgi:predicted O-methyltransferase YrrM
MRQLIAKARYQAGTYRQERGIVRTYRRRADEASSATEAVAAAFEVDAGPLTIRPVQVESEVANLVSLVAAERPQRVLEIGTANGGTLFLFAWASAPDARLLSLDIREYDGAHRRLFGSFGGRRRRTVVRKADSHDSSTPDAVRQFFDDLPVDFLFIDGDHSLESVRRDYELYAPLVRDGGLIAFHDIVEGPEELVGGVPRFWREVRSELAEPRELVESWDQGGYGIGVGRRVQAP